MLEKLPCQLDVKKLSLQAREIAFALEREVFTRLAQATQGVVEDATGVLRFSLYEGSYPQVELQVNTEVLLVCQRSLERYVQPLVAQVCLVFADMSATDWLPSQEVLPVEEMDEDPRVWIEDSLLLALPLVPVQPGSQPIEFQVGEVIERVSETVRPFANLKAMLQKE